MGDSKQRAGRHLRCSDGAVVIEPRVRLVLAVRGAHGLHRSISRAVALQTGTVEPLLETTLISLEFLPVAMFESSGYELSCGCLAVNQTLSISRSSSLHRVPKCPAFASLDFQHLSRTLNPDLPVKTVMLFTIVLLAVFGVDVSLIQTLPERNPPYLACTNMTAK